MKPRITPREREYIERRRQERARLQYEIELLAQGSPDENNEIEDYIPPPPSLSPTVSIEDEESIRDELHDILQDQIEEEWLGEEYDEEMENEIQRHMQVILYPPQPKGLHEPTVQRPRPQTPEAEEGEEEEESPFGANFRPNEEDDESERGIGEERSPISTAISEQEHYELMRELDNLRQEEQQRESSYEPSSEESSNYSQANVEEGESSVYTNSSLSTPKMETSVPYIRFEDVSNPHQDKNIELSPDEMIKWKNEQKTYELPRPITSGSTNMLTLWNNEGIKTKLIKPLPKFNEERKEKQSKISYMKESSTLYQKTEYELLQQIQAGKYVETLLTELIALA